MWSDLSHDTHIDTWLELQAVASWEDIISDPEIDAVVIGTWPYTHHTLVLAALQNNKHVLTEARMVSKNAVPICACTISNASWQASATRFHAVTSCYAMMTVINTQAQRQCVHGNLSAVKCSAELSFLPQLSLSHKCGVTVDMQWTL